MAGNNTGLQHLLEKIYNEHGFDFRGYKETTLTRRLDRRLQAQGVKTYADYTHILDQDPAEYDRLFNDLTIKVSGFFRDDVAFRALERVVLPVLTSRAEKSIRIWSAGCATGEEPYSIAILLLEMLGAKINRWDISIWGTDVDDKALDSARKGWFILKEMEGIHQLWLNKYFTPEDSGFRIHQLIKQLVIFEKHNLTSDPPHLDLDLVVCRNVLIYFAPALQTQVLKSFHSGLKDEGFLLLGKAETPAGKTKALFSPIDTRAKLFQKAV